MIKRRLDVVMRSSYAIVLWLPPTLQSRPLRAARTMTSMTSQNLTATIDEFKLKNHIKNRLINWLHTVAYRLVWICESGFHVFDTFSSCFYNWRRLLHRIHGKAASLVSLVRWYVHRDDSSQETSRRLYCDLVFVFLFFWQFIGKSC